MSAIKANVIFTILQVATIPLISQPEGTGEVEKSFGTRIGDATYP